MASASPKKPGGLPRLPPRADLMPREEAASERDALSRPIWDLNVRCLDLMRQAAAVPAADNFGLVRQVGDALMALDRETQERAAMTPFLLVDLEFSNPRWWQPPRSQAVRPAPPPWRGRFPRASARALARTTISVIWHGLGSDPHAACRFGMLPEVAATIKGLSLTELERIAERRFQYLRPRWEDRSDLWHELLTSANSHDYRLARAFNIRALQLMLGEMLPP